jgi:Family of unknown function (DUF5723)
MRLLKNLLFIALLTVLPLGVISQQVNTLYFLENYPLRNTLNPAFQPVNDVYISLPIIGQTQMSFGLVNSQLGLNNMLYANKFGDPVSFLASQAGQQGFLTAVGTSPTMLLDLQTNILGFGYRTKNQFWSFGITEKINGGLRLPGSMLDLLFNGVGESLHKSFDMTGFKFDLTAYTEFSVGCATDVNEYWSFGWRFKYLYGNANISLDNRNTNLDLSYDHSTLNVDANIYSATPMPILINPFSSNSLVIPSGYSASDFIMPTGHGAAVDFGFDFWPTEDISLSGSVTDLGFLYWTKNAQSTSVKMNNLTYNGVVNANGIDTTDFMFMKRLTQTSALSDSIMAQYNSKHSSTNLSKAYLTQTSAKLNLGAEYKFLGNSFSIGTLSRTYFSSTILAEEITASLNIRPEDWINLSTSYSFFNGRWSNMGVALALQGGPINFFIASDYVPLSYLPIKGMPIPIPYQTGMFNLALGVNIVFNELSDAELQQIEKAKQDRKYDCHCEDKLDDKVSSNSSYDNPVFGGHSSKIKNQIKKKAIHYQQEAPEYRMSTEPKVSPFFGQ